MLGTLVNAGAVIIGSVIGLLLGGLLPKRIGDSIMKGLGLVVLYIGISGALEGSNTIVLIISVVLGALTGELLDLDGKLNKLGELVGSNQSERGRKEIGRAGLRVCESPVLRRSYGDSRLAAKRIDRR